MTAYTTISNALVAVGAKPFASTVQAFRDNPIAIAEGDTTAPVNAACWHPYNMVLANDGATGRFYNATVVASVATPTMVAGWDYMFRGVAISHNSGSSQTFNVNGVSSGFANSSAAIVRNFWFTLINPAITNFPKHVSEFVWDTPTVANPPPTFFTNNATALTTFNFTWSAGSFDGGEMFMYRRRNYMP